MYSSVRAQSTALTEGLTAEDMVAQSMPDASPIKWHLAHTTWFFETFLLKSRLKNYREFDSEFPHLFNSYYVSAGTRHARPQRGLLTRPSLDRVLEYRAYVDREMQSLLDQNDAECNKVVEVGLHHEMQHQELMMTDLLHLMSCNPTHPIVFNTPKLTESKASRVSMVDRPGDMVHVGASGEEFSYDCENPRHLMYLSPHKLADRLVTNEEWLQFMDDGGYGEPLLWLSDGWAQKEKEDWQAPLYWVKKNDLWSQYGLDGLKAIHPLAPVTHVSFYEADAFARWAGKRLPREHELENAALEREIKGNFLESKKFRSTPLLESDQGIKQLYGDVWEWTQSAYAPYPNFNPEQGALGEYNGKFMINQMVLKGGSCVTPKAQMRPSYRNFFYPHHRWQFTGLRLAEDL